MILKSYFLTQKGSVNTPENLSYNAHFNLQTYNKKIQITNIQFYVYVDKRNPEYIDGLNNLSYILYMCPGSFIHRKTNPMFWQMIGHLSQDASLLYSSLTTSFHQIINIPLNITLNKRSRYGFYLLSTHCPLLLSYPFAAFHGTDDVKFELNYRSSTSKTPFDFSPLMDLERHDYVAFHGSIEYEIKNEIE